MFKINNKDTRTTLLVSLLLILNIFHTLFYQVFLLLTLNMQLPAGAGGSLILCNESYCNETHVSTAANEFNYLFI